MSIIGVVIILIVVGLLLALVQKLPIDPLFVWIIRAVVILVVVVWLLNLFLPGLGVLRPIGR